MSNAAPSIEFETLPAPSEVEKTRAARARRAAAREAELDRLEVLEEQLEAKYEKELGGPRGIAFELVEIPGGFAVLRVGNILGYTKWQKAENTEPNMHEYVDPNVVYPPLPAFLAAIANHGGVIVRCMLALSRLHEGRVDRQRGK